MTACFLDLSDVALPLSKALDRFVDRAEMGWPPYCPSFPRRIGGLAQLEIVCSLFGTRPEAAGPHRHAPRNRTVVHGRVWTCGGTGKTPFVLGSADKRVADDGSFRFLDIAGRAKMLHPLVFQRLRGEADGRS